MDECFDMCSVSTMSTYGEVLITDCLMSLLTSNHGDTGDTDQDYPQTLRLRRRILQTSSPLCRFLLKMINTGVCVLTLNLLTVDYGNC